jgi:hypothetical protein
MQDKRVIYPNNEGGVSIIVPAPDATLEQVLKAVPEGTPYQVVTIVKDRTHCVGRKVWRLGRIHQQQPR